MFMDMTFGCDKFLNLFMFIFKERQIDTFARVSANFIR